MKPSNTTTSGKATGMIGGICTFPRLPCPCTKRQVMLNLTSTGVCNTGTSAMYVCNLLLWLTLWWMLLCRTIRKVSSTNMRNKHVRRDSKMCCCCCCRFCCGALTTDERIHAPRTPWCIADCLLQVMRSRLITVMVRPWKAGNYLRNG